MHALPTPPTNTLSLIGVCARGAVNQTWWSKKKKELSPLQSVVQLLVEVFQKRGKEKANLKQVEKK